jgi:hypothetical protein
MAKLSPPPQFSPSIRADRGATDFSNTLSAKRQQRTKMQRNKQQAKVILC